VWCSGLALVACLGCATGKGVDDGLDGAVDGPRLAEAAPDVRARDVATRDALVGDLGIEVGDAGQGEDAAADDGPGDGSTTPVDGALAADAAASRCAPVECAEVSGMVAEHHLTGIDPCGFALRREAPPDGPRALADDLAERADGYVSLFELDLNRATRPGITDGAADRLRNHAFVGFRWNSGDAGTAAWYPQGITGHSDAGDDAARWLLVSWYDNGNDAFEKGARVSLINPDHTRYRHLLLVVPFAEGGATNFTAARTDAGGSLHAGGIVWFGDKLYVADTTQGFRVFDLGRVIQLSHTDDKQLVGVRPDRVDAHGYLYMVPQIARYRLTAESCPLRFSYVGLDRSEPVPSLVTGEYRSDDHNGRMARWPLDTETGWLVEEPGGSVYPTEAVVAGQTRMQGGLTWEGDYYISSSSQIGNLGRLYRNRPEEESRITAWPRGCEDLYYERGADLVWTPTEHPNAREVVGIPLVRP